jgi:hypothetical protein
MSIKIGMFLPCGSGVEPEPIFIEDYNSIQTAIGGNFDVVRTDVKDNDKHRGVIVGYVHDEGLLLGQEMNFLATNLFKKNLVGDCVVLWGTSPNGEYDGDDYDMPDDLVEYIQSELVLTTSEAYNQSAMMAMAARYAVEHGYCSAEVAYGIADRLHQASVRGNQEEAQKVWQEMDTLIKWVTAHVEENPTELDNFFNELLADEED